MSRFIDGHRDAFGVEPIAHTLGGAPSTYYAARSRPPSARAQRGAFVKPVGERVHAEHVHVYGRRQLGCQLQREGVAVGRDQVARLMRELGLAGVVRGKRRRTTVPTTAARSADRVQRQFRAGAPNPLWVADITYVPIDTGFCYTAFITDVFSRRIVGGKVGTSLGEALAVDALAMAVCARHGTDLRPLIHHSDRGSQDAALRYTEHLAVIGALASVGSTGDRDDNAVAEAVNGLYKAELIRPQGPWATTADVERATARWVAWWNDRRLHEAGGYVPPAEFEQRAGATEAVA